MIFVWKCDENIRNWIVFINTLIRIITWYLQSFIDEQVCLYSFREIVELIHVYKDQIDHWVYDHYNPEHVHKFSP